MATPLPPTPGETPEQRQARLNAAYAVQARIDKERRDEEARRATEVSVAVPRPATKSASPFDPNSALRQFNQYFGTLQKQYGSAGLRNTGFTPRDLAAMQATLRKLQMDPNATPEQHQQAYQQARDTLAQRITTPQSAQSIMMPPPERERPQTAGAPQPDMPGIVVTPPPGPYYSEYLASLSAKPQPERPPLAVMPERPMPTPMPEIVTPPPGSSLLSGLFDRSRSDTTQPAQSNPAFVGKNFTGDAPPPGMKWVETGSGLVPVPANEGAASAAPSGPALGSSLGSNSLPSRMMPLAQQPAPASGGIADLLRGVTPPAAPSMNTQPGADFDRNIFSKMLNDQFGQLRQKYGVAGLQSAGFTPRTLAELQSGLRNLQMDPNSTYDQNSAALEAALARMNSYNFNAPVRGTPVGASMPQLVAAPTPMPQPVATPTPMPQPVATPTPMPQPVATPTPMPIPATGMYQGGYAVRR